MDLDKGGRSMIPETHVIEKTETTAVSAQAPQAVATQIKGDLAEEELAKVAGGINPQPLPPDHTIVCHF
jgi:hypothetical protein